MGRFELVVVSSQGRQDSFSDNGAREKEERGGGVKTRPGTAWNRPTGEKYHSKAKKKRGKEGGGFTQGGSKKL